MQGHIGLICPKVVIGEEVNSDTPMKARKKHISPSSLDPLMKAVAMDVNSGNQSVPQSDFPSSSKVVAAIVIVSDNRATPTSIALRVEFLVAAVGACFYLSVWDAIVLLWLL
ncbi:hypothetical protein NC652_011364 [Populus alba x Populus x berolinensis]|uniref:Uncharacterized protein n=1 Tax=Populus alba x Populus x berolinensis TaxID=444605 RepID=A0AAD6W6W8_9ROSI|nr:hypothetical protein NC652_011364 [Populus alba x Populus x berolinensis]KAJ7000966.1 hypothetical protein NC653_011427 [Populus alba x Populus x berolinensis]